MKYAKFTCWSFLTASLALAVLLTPLLMSSSSAVQANDIVYKPPVTSAPIRRVGAGTRGLCKQVSAVDNTFALQVLAPDTIGQTILVQPTLYWWVSKPVSGKFIFTLTGGSQRFSEPLLDTTKTLSVKAGIQAFSLPEYHVSLKPGTNYKWSVSLQCDASNPSLNVVSTGMIKQVTPNADLEKKFKQAKLENLPYLYATSGYWYDSLSSLAELIEKNPTDKKWREVRASLLKQGGLNKVATIEK